MKSKSIKGTSVKELQVHLLECLSDGFKPTLAIVFASISQDLDAIRGMLDKENIDIFGATTCGEFIDGEVGSGGIAMLLLEINPEYYSIMLEGYQDKDPIAVAVSMATRAKERFSDPCFIISAGIHASGQSEMLLGDPMLRAIESAAGQQASIWGGRAGDDFAFGETMVFTNRLLTQKGIIMLVIDGAKILVRGEAASGQQPVGTEKVITKAIGNWVYEIDNQPALEVVFKYLGMNLTQAEAETFYANGNNVVFSVHRDEGEPVLRGGGMFNWAEKSIYVLGKIQQGDRIRLTLPPDFEVVEQVSRNALRIQQEELPEADALLMFSCVGRLGQFGPLIGEEIEGVRKIFNVPMAGFFTYGEFGRTRNGLNEFHTNTCCWIALKEKP